MTALVVQTTDVLDTANTYIDVTALDLYCTDRGITLTASTNGAKTALIFKAMDYLETLYYQGNLAEEGQTTQEPRDYVYINDYLQTYAQILARMVKAQCELVIAYDAGYDPLVTLEREVKSEQLGPMRIEYTDNASSNTILQKVDAILDPLLSSGSDFISFKTCNDEHQ